MAKWQVPGQTKRNHMVKAQTNPEGWCCQSLFALIQLPVAPTPLLLVG